jgi:hypothetical protein
VVRPTCHGNGSEHCCYVAGQVCTFLEVDTVPDRHWVCGLRRELGNWDAVHADPRYQPIHAEWVKVNGSDCGDFRGAGLSDGTIEGHCCFAGYVFDASGDVISEPD